MNNNRADLSLLMLLFTYFYNAKRRGIRHECVSTKKKYGVNVIAMSSPRYGIPHERRKTATATVR
jgi:hypothetical protein